MILGDLKAVVEERKELKRNPKYATPLVSNRSTIALETIREVQRKGAVHDEKKFLQIRDNVIRVHGRLNN